MAQSNSFINKKEMIRSFIDVVESSFIVTKKNNFYFIQDDSEDIYSSRVFYDLLVNKSNIDINFSWETFCELINSFVLSEPKGIEVKELDVVITDPVLAFNNFLFFMQQMQSKRTNVYVFETSFNLVGNKNSYIIEGHNSTIKLDITLNRKVVIEYTFDRIDVNGRNNDDYAESIINSYMNCLDLFLKDSFIVKHIYKNRSVSFLGSDSKRVLNRKEKKINKFKMHLDKRYSYTDINIEERLTFIKYMWGLYDIFYTPNEYYVELDMNEYLKNKNSSIKGIDVKNYNTISQFTEVFSRTNSKEDLSRFYLEFLSVFDDIFKLTDNETRDKFDNRLKLSYRNLMSTDLPNYQYLVKNRNTAAHNFNPKHLLKYNDSEAKFEQILNEYIPFISKLIEVSSEPINSGDNIFIKYITRLTSTDAQSLDHSIILPKLSLKENKIIYKSLAKGYEYNQLIKSVFGTLITNKTLSAKIKE